MTLYIGVDFHPHQQTLSWCETETGETQTLTLVHELEKVRQFYQSIPPAIIGIEASCKAVWFEHLVAQSKHQLQVGNPVLIRKRATSRNKSDRLDAELMLELLLKGEFPTLWRRSIENTQVLEVLKMRANLVRQRTQLYNRLQALAHNFGLPKGKMGTGYFQSLLKSVEVDRVGELQRDGLFNLLESLNQEIRSLERWLEVAAAADQTVQLLMTQPGVGYLTALAVVNTVGELTRFAKPTKQVAAYIGLDPLTAESAGKKKKAPISRAGNSLTRHLLGQAAHIAIRSDPKLKAFYKRLAKRKPKPVAKTATARKLLVKLVIMWRDQLTAREFDQGGRTVNDTRTAHGLQ